MLPKPFDLNVLKELSEQRYTVLKELGDCYVQCGEYDKAGPCYKEAIALRPDMPDAYVALGLLAVQANQLDLGRQALQRALDIDTEQAEAYGGLAVIHQREGNYEDAFEMYLQSLQRDTDNLLALLGLFQTSCKMGTFGQIIEYLEIYLDRHPEDTSVLFCLASLYAREARLAEARDLLQRLLRLQPGKVEARELLQKVEKFLQPVG